VAAHLIDFSSIGFMRNCHPAWYIHQLQQLTDADLILTIGIDVTSLS